jgi:hypothetical protein
MLSQLSSAHEAQRVDLTRDAWLSVGEERKAGLVEVSQTFY